MANEKIDMHEVVKELIGPIAPLGAEHLDRVRHENLSAMIVLADALMYDIYQVSKHADRPENSMAKAGKLARTFCNDLGCYHD